MTTTNQSSKDYYRNITEVDIGDVARDLLGSRITIEANDKLECDCPRHSSQSKRSFQVNLIDQLWYCFGCGKGGDVLQLVEFIQSGQVTQAHQGAMPQTHRDARDYLARKAGMPPMGEAFDCPEKLAKNETAWAQAQTAFHVLGVLMEYYHFRLKMRPDVLKAFIKRYGFTMETIDKLKIGFTDNDSHRGVKGALDYLCHGPHHFTDRDLLSSGAFHLTRHDTLFPAFRGRISFPYWRQGKIVYGISRKTRWTENSKFEGAKYKKLMVHKPGREYISPAIDNAQLYNEDILLRRPEYLVVTEGVTDCISLIQNGIPAISPVTVRIKNRDWDRILNKAAGVERIYICQDNELSEAGLKGALDTARRLAKKNVQARIVTLPLTPENERAREELAAYGITPGHVALPGRHFSSLTKEEMENADRLKARSKIDVNEYFTSGHTADDFKALLKTASLPLDFAIGRLTSEKQAESLRDSLSIFEEIAGLDPLDQKYYLKQIQKRLGGAFSLGDLQKQLTAVSKKLKPKKGVPESPESHPDYPVSTSNYLYPKIQVNNRQDYHIVLDSWRAVKAANQAKPFNGPFLFQRCGSLVRLEHQKPTPIVLVDEAIMYGICIRTAHWVRINKEEVVNASPPQRPIKDMLTNIPKGIDELEEVIRLPVFGHCGILIDQPGYNRDNKVWLEPGLKVPLGSIPKKPTQPEVDAARNLLEDLLVDFPFKSESDRSHALAAIFNPFVRRVIDEIAPLHLIEAASPGTGKGLLSNVISIIYTGREMDISTFPDNEEEMRKKITSVLAQGSPYIMFDNLDETKRMSSPGFAAVLTSKFWNDRLLGTNQTVSFPNTSTWLMTGNNPRFSLDIARRCLRIRMEAGMEKPWQRQQSEFKHVLPEYAIENRNQLIHAVLLLVQNWVAKGMPKGNKPMGSFGQWAKAMGGIMATSGIKGFLGGLNDLHDEVDEEKGMWEEFVYAWWDHCQAKPIHVADLLQLCKKENLLYPLLGEGSERALETRLGKGLKSIRGRWFKEWKIVWENKGRKRNSYKLVPSDALINRLIHPEHFEASVVDTL